MQPQQDIIDSYKFFYENYGTSLDTILQFKCEYHEKVLLTLENDSIFSNVDIATSILIYFKKLVADKIEPFFDNKNADKIIAFRGGNWNTTRIHFVKYDEIMKIIDFKPNIKKYLKTLGITYDVYIRSVDEIKAEVKVEVKEDPNMKSLNELSDLIKSYNVSTAIKYNDNRKFVKDSIELINKMNKVNEENELKTCKDDNERYIVLVKYFFKKLEIMSERANIDKYSHVSFNRIYSEYGAKNLHYYGINNILFNPLDEKIKEVFTKLDIKYTSKFKV
jgi:hypothetical protein